MNQFPSPMRMIILVIVLLAILFGVLFIANRAGFLRKGIDNTEKVIQGSAEKSGGFTVRYAPSSLSFDKKSSESKIVTVMVVPETDNFNEPVAVWVEDVLFGETSTYNEYKEKKDEVSPIRAQFSGASVEKENYEAGIPLIVSAEEAAVGEYAIVAVAVAGGAKVPIVIPVVVEE